MILLIMGIVILVLFFVFRKLIKTVFRILFYIGVIVVIFLGIAYFSKNIDDKGALNTIGTGATTVVNSNLTINVENYLTNGIKNIIVFTENKAEKGVSDLFNSEFGSNGVFNGTGDGTNRAMTLNDYRNSSIYGKEIFKKGDNYVYINGMLCEKSQDNGDTYSIYEANVDGNNYKPVGNFNNNFSGFSIGSSSITIDGITYYKGLSYNQIDVYGELYGTKEGELENIKTNKIKYKNSDEKVYINNSEYKLGRGNSEIKINDQIYSLENGINIKLGDYLNINGFLYWQSKDKNSTSITIDGVNYICEKNNFLENLL